MVTPSSTTRLTSRTVLSTLSVHHSGGQWHWLVSHSTSSRLRAAAASSAVTRTTRVPERTVSTPTSNSGNVGFRHGAHEDPRLPIGNAVTNNPGKLDGLAFKCVRTDGALFVLGEQVGPEVVAIAYPAGSPVGAVDQDAKWLGLTTGWASHDLDQDARLGKFVGWDMVEMLGREARSLGKPALQPAWVEPLGGAWPGGDQRSGRVDIPVQLS